MHLHIAVLALGLSLTTAAAQSSQLPRVPGRSIVEHFQPVNGSPATEHTMTLTFGADDERTAFTIAFVTRLAPSRQMPMGVVDVIVTQYQPADWTPTLVVDADGVRRTPMARVQSRRSLATTMSFDEFLTLSRASTLVERAFDTELDVSPGQLRMLQRIANRWTSGSQR